MNKYIMFFVVWFAVCTGIYFTGNFFLEKQTTREINLSVSQLNNPDAAKRQEIKTDFNNVVHLIQGVSGALVGFYLAAYFLKKK